jgi:hypothetical protein
LQTVEAEMPSKPDAVGTEDYGSIKVPTIEANLLLSVLSQFRAAWTIGGSKDKYHESIEGNYRDTLSNRSCGITAGSRERG